MTDKITAGQPAQRAAAASAPSVARASAPGAAPPRPLRIPQPLQPVTAPPRPVARIPRPTAGMLPQRPRRKAGPRVLVVLRATERPAPTLQRAMALARSLDASVHVLQVLPPRSRLEALFERRDVAAAARAVERTLRAHQGLRSWLREALGSEGVITQLGAARGDLVEHAAAQAAMLEASLIVLAPAAERQGRTVASLASVAGVPVLVASEPTSSRAIVAGTQLEGDGQPGARGGAPGRERPEVALVAQHEAASASPAPEDATSPADERWTSPRELLAALHEPSLEAQAIVLAGPSSAQAILAEADKLDADVVIVGTRRRGWLEGQAPDVASEVVDRARRSVLVLPIEAAPEASPAARARRLVLSLARGVRVIPAVRAASEQAPGS